MPPSDTTNFKLENPEGRPLPCPDTNQLDVRADSMGVDRVFTPEGGLCLDPNPEMETEGKQLIKSWSIKYLKHHKMNHGAFVKAGSKAFATTFKNYVGDKASSDQFQSLCLDAT